MSGERKPIDIVENLIQDCHDAQQGYRDAAEHASDQELRAFFSEQSVERAGFASVLEQKAQPLLGQGQAATNGAVHRKWSALKQHPGGSDKGLLAAVEAAEAQVRKDYDEALQQDLPDDLPEIVQQQAEAVKAAHDHLRIMQERMAREEAA